MDSEILNTVLLHVSVFFSVLVWLRPGSGRVFRRKLKKWGNRITRKKCASFPWLLIAAMAICSSCAWQIKDAKRNKEKENAVAKAESLISNIRGLAARADSLSENEISMEYQGLILPQENSVLSELYKVGGKYSIELDRMGIESTKLGLSKRADAYEDIVKSLKD